MDPLFTALAVPPAAVAESPCVVLAERDEATVPVAVGVEDKHVEIVAVRLAPDDALCAEDAVGESDARVEGEATTEYEAVDVPVRLAVDDAVSVFVAVDVAVPHDVAKSDVV